MSQHTAICGGARGQDAAWISRLLLDQGWKVYAFERHTQNPNYNNIQDIMNHSNYFLEKADVTDGSSIARLVSLVKPDHFYHLAANSFVGCSWNEPISVLRTNTEGTLNCLEAVRLNSPKTKFLLASTSECVGNSEEEIQNEHTKLSPHSPYAASKAAAEHFVKVYRFSHKMFACYTRCYNHESIFRGKEFVTRKITSWIGENFNKVEQNIEKIIGQNQAITVEDAFGICLKEGIINKLVLGNLDSSRDWLDARDCVRGMHMVLNQDKPDDYVLASNTMRSISDFLTEAFGVIGIKQWQHFIGQDPRFLRPSDIVTLRGDYSKAKRELGWEPTISFKTMVSDMIRNDIELNKHV